MEIIQHTFYKVSEIEPEVLRHFMINEVGERAKDKLYNYLRDLTESYPDFENWFYNVVIPEVELKDGKREIIIVLSEIEDIPKPYYLDWQFSKKQNARKNLYN